VLPILTKIIGLAKLNNSGNNCKKYVGRKQQVFEILSMFGKYAEGKRIPQFIHDGPKNLIAEFIKGYQKADGCETKDGISYTTVSEDIAYGLQLLYAKLGVKASVYSQKRPKKTQIEGRIVNQKNTFSINISKQKNKSKKYIFDENYLWLKIKDIEEINNDGYVYNISTENNHTYNVYNLINHNCHYGFQLYSEELTEEERIELAGGKIQAKYPALIEQQIRVCDERNIPKRRLSLIWDQRSCDTFLGIPFNIASYGILLHMFAQQANMVPDRLIGSLKNVHVYNNHIDQCKEQIAREPRELPKLVLNKAKDIFSYTYDDIQIVDYNPHDKIAGAISV
jgi:hypothetical protein